MGRFDGKVVLITGGARGQGRSHAVAFAREGADVAICDIAGQIDTVPFPMGTAEDLQETARLVEAEGRRCLSVKADVRDLAQMQGFVDQARSELGRVDFLLANAGISTYASIAEMSDQEWRDVIDVNLTGVFHAIKAVLPGMIEQQSGRIVATASQAGKMGMPHIGHYVASKWGLIGLVKTVAREVAHLGITANVICPTAVDTPMIHNEASYGLFRPDKENPTREDAEEAMRALNAMPIAWVDPIDITNAIMFLCSDDARYITGETISVAAGQNATNAA